MEPLKVPGRLDSLKAIAEYAKTAAREAGLDSKTAYQLRMAVDEIATNSIIHGYQRAGLEGELSCQAFLGEATLTIFLEDTGVPFDPTAQPTPKDLDKLLENRSVGGLGIYLATQGIDQLMYERIKDRNRTIFVVQRHL